MAESEKDQRIHELEAEIATLKEQLAYLTRKIYASKSETIDPNQTSLFDKEDRVFTEPEQTGDQSSAASNQVQPKKSKKKARQEKIDAKVPVRVTIIEPADGKCPAGHSGITPIGKNMCEKNCMSFQRTHIWKRSTNKLISVNSVLRIQQHLACGSRWCHRPCFRIVWLLSP